MEDGKETRLYLVYDTESTGGDILEEQEDTDYEDKYITTTYDAVYRTPPNNRFFYDSIIVDPDLVLNDEVFLAVIYYTDGNTFGTTHGNQYFIGLYSSYKQAENAISEYMKGDSYKPYESYFASYDSNDIVLLKVRN